MHALCILHLRILHLCILHLCILHLLHLFILHLLSVAMVCHCKSFCCRIFPWQRKHEIADPAVMTKILWTATTTSSLQSLKAGARKTLQTWRDKMHDSEMKKILSYERCCLVELLQTNAHCSNFCIRWSLYHTSESEVVKRLKHFSF